VLFLFITERGFSCLKHGTARRKKPLKEGHIRLTILLKFLGIGRTSAYILVKEGHFKIVRIGNAIRISKRSFDEWLDSLDL